MTIEEKVFHLHDVEVNQKYGVKLQLPYSFHIKMVMNQHKRFKHLLTTEEEFIAYYGALAHDLIEDCRLTYNDVKELMIKYETIDIQGTFKNLSTRILAEQIADAVYCVTDFKGKNRVERKPPQYYRDLNNNKTALFVKLCDMIANKYFSCMTGSSMKEAYNKEFPSFKEKCYYEPYKEMFDLLQNLD